MILITAELYESKQFIEDTLKECGELIAIFATSIITAEKNLLNEFSSNLLYLQNLNSLTNLIYLKNDLRHKSKLIDCKFVYIR